MGYNVYARSRAGVGAGRYQRSPPGLSKSETQSRKICSNPPETVAKASFSAIYQWMGVLWAHKELFQFMGLRIFPTNFSSVLQNGFLVGPPGPDGPAFLALLKRRDIHKLPLLVVIRDANVKNPRCLLREDSVNVCFSV